MKASAAAELTDLLGTDAVVREPEVRERWRAGDRVPDAVVFPRSVDELAGVLGRASEEGWPVLPAGGGSWIEGGGAPSDVRLVVSTRDMSEVAEYEPGDLTLTAGAGLSLSDLEETVARHGQWLPQDPPHPGRTSLGALVSTGLPGPLVAGFGRPRDQILGLTAVTGDGRVVRPGGRVVKNVAGYDLVRLLTGSWGTLGVVAGATVRLYPRPERDVTLLFRAPSPVDLVAAGRALATAPVVPDALELVFPASDVGLGTGGDERAPAAGSAGGPRGAGRDGGRAVLAARILGSREEVSEKARILRDTAGSEPDVRLEDAGSVELHEKLSGAIPAGGLALRLSLLPGLLGTLVEEARELGSRARAGGMSSHFAAHVTRGVVRLEVTGRPDDGAFGPDWVDTLRELRSRLRAAGGSMMLVRGPTSLVRAVGVRGGEGARERLLEGLKDEFDPADVLAPGRLGLPGSGS